MSSLEDPGAIAMVPGVTMNRLGGHRNDSIISMVAIERPMSPTAALVVAGQGEILVAILVPPIWFLIEGRIGGTSG